MEEFLKKKTVDLFERDQNKLDDAFKGQSPDITAPKKLEKIEVIQNCLLYTSPSPRDLSTSRMPSSA